MVAAAISSPGALKVFTVASARGFSLVAQVQLGKITSVGLVQPAGLVLGTSEDGTVAAWDVRVPTREAFRVGPTDEGAIWSADMAGNTLVSGAASGAVLVYDVRKLGGPRLFLEDTHGDLVTGCTLTPQGGLPVSGGPPSAWDKSENVLLTCSVDGQIAVSDLSETDPDECFKACTNTSDSLDEMGLFGPGLGQVWARSDTFALHMWDWRDALREDDGGGAAAVSVPEARDMMTRATESSGVLEAGAVEYMLGCRWDGTSLWALGGNEGGFVGMARLAGQGQLGPVETVLTPGGHQGGVRRAVFVESDAGQPWLCVTGGEDGHLCLWDERYPGGTNEQSQKGKPGAGTGKKDWRKGAKGGVSKHRKGGKKDRSRH